MLGIVRNRIEKNSLVNNNKKGVCIMDPKGKIWVALDTDKKRALEIAKAVGNHPAVYGFKLNRVVDQEVFREDGEPKLFEELSKYDRFVWVDFKFYDIPRTVVGRIEPYIASGMVNYLTVMAKGEVDMMMGATELVNSLHANAHIIAVTELTSFLEEQVHLGSGHPAKASVINLARNSVLAGVKHLVCSSQELVVLSKRRELAVLDKFIPGITPAYKLGKDEFDQKRTGTPEFALSNGADKLVIGSAIVNADNPLEAVEKTALEIQDIPEKD